jgi:hypothetical protein
MFRIFWNPTVPASARLRPVGKTLTLAVAVYRFVRVNEYDAAPITVIVTTKKMSHL